MTIDRLNRDKALEQAVLDCCDPGASLRAITVKCLRGISERRVLYALLGLVGDGRVKVETSPNQELIFRAVAK